MRALVVLVSCVIAASATAAPRVRPFLAAPGQPLGGTAIAATFCATSKRAVVRLDTGDIVAIDAAGTITVLASLGRMTNVVGAIACDKKDRIVLAAAKTIVIVNGSTSTQEPMVNEVRHVRLLDDDSIGIVDSKGDMYRWDGTKVAHVWGAGQAVNQRGPFELHGSGDRYMVMFGGRVVVVDRTGRKDGPRCVGASWHDADTLVIAERTGMLSRWKVGTDEKLLEPI